jgi:preprotein translocase subunit YajC
MGELTLFLPLLVIMGAFMFFASRRQKKAMQATVDLHDSLAIGDEVMTTAGLYGTVTAIGDTKIDVEIAPGVVVSMLKMAIKDRVTADDDDLEDHLEDDEYEDDDDAEDYEVAGSTAVEIDRHPTTTSDAPADPNRLAKD